MRGALLVLLAVPAQAALPRVTIKVSPAMQYQARPAAPASVAPALHAALQLELNLAVRPVHAPWLAQVAPPRHLEAGARALDQLREAAAPAENVWVKEADYESSPLAVPWERYRSMLLKRGAAALRRAKPEPRRFDKLTGKAKLRAKMEASAAAAEAAAALPAPAGPSHPELAGAAKTARKVLESIPFLDDAAGVEGARLLGAALAALVHHGEEAQSDPAARAAAADVKAAYARFGESLEGAGGLERYAARERRRDEFFRRLKASWVAVPDPDEYSARERWLRSLLETLE